jgi:acyl-CoA reductase-like NAD-dependent aldehyde dehydrogenase
MTVMPNLIGGDWKCGTDARPIDPSGTNDLVRDYTDATSEQVEEATHSAQAAARAWAVSPLGARASRPQVIANEIGHRGVELSSISLWRKKRRHTGLLAASALILSLLTESSNDARMNREKVFGPVACIISVRDYEEALVVANDTEFGLSSGEHFKAEREAVFPW